jgi:TonB family protein
VRRFAAILAAATLACGGSAPPPVPEGAQAPPPPESEAPVALNPDVPIAYPAALFDQRIEGEVVLRLFTDSTGRLIPESTRVAESSNYPALDSAALAGAAKLHFAPAKRRGVPVATTFLQPVEFHHPGTAATGTAVAPPAATVRPPQRVTAEPNPAPPPPPSRVAAPRVRPSPSPDTTRVPRDTTRQRVDTTRHPADTTRHPADTTRHPTDTTRTRPDTSGATH